MTRLHAGGARIRNVPSGRGDRLSFIDNRSFALNPLKRLSRGLKGCANLRVVRMDVSESLHVDIGSASLPICFVRVGVALPRDSPTPHRRRGVHGKL